jgi:predicted  nucleic acid-binding Zn-ribbon protein
MALEISASTRIGGMGSQSQINLILSNIKGLRKQLKALQKQLSESTDPNEQKLLMKQIIELQRIIEMQEQQIANIQREEVRKQQQRDKINGTRAA